MAEHKDILSEPTERKEEIYKLIDDLVRLFDFPVSIKEHKSGFPAMTVDCGGIHILTDVLTVEQWQAKRKREAEIQPARELRAEKDDVQSWLRQLGLLQSYEYIESIHIEPGELVISIGIETEVTFESEPKV
jgi:hypothetical protein